jgi:E3 SUMO-protein ligase PIAS1
MSDITDKYKEAAHYIEEVLTVTHLKAVLRAAALSTSGRKQFLQERLMSKLQIGLRANDMQQIALIHDAAVMAYGHPLVASNRAPAPQPTYTVMVNTLTARQTTQPTRPQPLVRMEFVDSPFYTILRMLKPPMVFRPPYPSTDRITQAINFVLSGGEIPMVVNGDWEVYFMSLELDGTSNKQPIQFPGHTELVVNQELLMANTRGIKGRKGTTRPADCSRLVKKAYNMNKGLHTVDVTITFPRDPNNSSKEMEARSKSYAMAPFLCKPIRVSELLEELKSRPRIPIEQVKNMIREANQDEDIVATATVHTLKDPVSFSRIGVPVRSVMCQHIDCLDAESYLQLQMQAPTWVCSICNRPAHYSDLAVDSYFEEILRSTSPSVQEIEVTADGHWRAPQGGDMMDSDSDSDDALSERVRKQIKTESFVPVTTSTVVIDLDSDDSDLTVAAPPMVMVQNGHSNGHVHRAREMDDLQTILNLYKEPLGPSLLFDSRNNQSPAFLSNIASPDGENLMADPSWGDGSLLFRTPPTDSSSVEPVAGDRVELQQKSPQQSPPPIQSPPTHQTSAVNLQSSMDMSPLPRPVEMFRPREQPKFQSPYQPLDRLTPTYSESYRQPLQPISERDQYRIPPIQLPNPLPQPPLTYRRPSLAAPERSPERLRRMERNQVEVIDLTLSDDD